MMLSDVMAIITIITSMMGAFFTFMQNWILISDLKFSLMNLIVASGWLALCVDVVRWIQTPRGK
jgi:hypothetical protein